MTNSDGAEPLYLYSVRGVASRLGVRPATVRGWISSGELGGGELGGVFLAGSRWRITSAAITDFLNGATDARLNQ